jgi:hypothetical protein
MAAMDTYLLCGCPSGTIDQPAATTEHKAGCWLAEVEAIATEVVTAVRLRDECQPGDVLIAVVAALAEAVYLAADPTDDQLIGLLDALVELELLGKPLDPTGPAQDGAA